MEGLQGRLGEGAASECACSGACPGPAMHTCEQKRGPFAQVFHPQHYHPTGWAIHPPACVAELHPRSMAPDARVAGPAVAAHLERIDFAGGLFGCNLSCNATCSCPSCQLVILSYPARAPCALIEQRVRRPASDPSTMQPPALSRGQATHDWSPIKQAREMHPTLSPAAGGGRPSSPSPALSSSPASPPPAPAGAVGSALTRP